MFPPLTVATCRLKTPQRSGVRGITVPSTEFFSLEDPPRAGSHDCLFRSGHTGILLASMPGPWFRPRTRSKKPTSVLDFTMKDIDGKDVPLAKFQGKVLLIVNTASQCGYTPQYKGLQEIYQKYKDQGLEILAFPANEFGAQEPGTDDQIKQFCTANYKVSFPLFSKIVVKGPAIHPLYDFLTSEIDRPHVRRRDPLEFRQIPGQPQGRGHLPVPAGRQARISRVDQRDREGSR